MATQPIGHTAHSYTYQKPRRRQEDAEFPLGPEQSKKRQPEVVQTGPTARDHIRSLLSAISGGTNERLSFQDVADHRDGLKSRWDSEVSEDLKTLGVSMSDRFRLMVDPATDSVTTGSDHPDKQKIDAYFASHPERADEFKTLIQLDKLAETAENRLSPDNMQQSLLPDAMAWWYQTNMDTSSLFSGGGMIFGTGGSAYKGLDIRV